MNCTIEQAKCLIKSFKSATYSEFMACMICDSFESFLDRFEKIDNELDELKIILDMYGGEEGITEAFRKAEKLDKVIETFIPHQCSLCIYHHDNGGCEKDLWALNVPNCEDWGWNNKYKRKW